MVKPAGKRNKAAARSCVILGTVLAGAAIWFSVTNAARPVSQNSSAALNGASSASASTLNTGNVTTSQSVVTSSVPQQPQITPILRTRGS